ILGSSAAGNSLTGSNSDTVWTLTGPNQGRAGSVAFSAFANLQGGSGNNTLVGANSNNSWSLTGPNQGTLNSMQFQAMQNLTGGSLADTFVFGPAGSVAGTIDGGSGSDAMDYPGYG